LLAEPRSFVLATGGGIVENTEAWALLEERATTVWLRASTHAHWSRVVRQGDPRPMAGVRRRRPSFAACSRAARRSIVERATASTPRGSVSTVASSF